VEFRHIRYFLTLAEELNFSRAAKRLHMAQPPLSRQIRELEKELGTKLFNRTNRRVELTDAGKIFLEKSSQIFQQLEKARIVTRLTSLGKDGQIHIGFTGSVETLVPFLQKYAEEYPNIGIMLQIMSTAEQIKALYEKRLDVGIISVPIFSHLLNVKPLYKSHFRAVLSEIHPLASKKSLYIHELAEESFIMTPRSVGEYYYDTFINIFQSAGITPKITTFAHDVQTCLTLVSSGMGVTLTSVVMESIRGVVYREIEDMDKSLIIEKSVAWRKDESSEIIKKFVKFLFDFYNIEN
jgi:DNA-binding transcriptional LysR family regulator